MARSKRTAEPEPTAAPAPVEEVDFPDEARAAFIQFGTYTNFGRALPAALDGLKPVHRRILWAMREMGARPDRPRVKSARAVGEATGKFHPHGDAAAYDTLARMAQDFSLLVPLISGQGNFGNLNFAPAAARYTECRLSTAAMALLGDLRSVGLDGSPEIDEDGVDLIPNYSGEFEEPVVLPALWPALVVNGYEGIGVGIAGKSPSHNLTEVMDLAIHMVDSPNPRWSTIEQILPAPDFPCDCDIFDVGDDEYSGIRSYMETGEGSFVMRARIEVEQTGTGKGRRSKLTITGLPYQISPEHVVAGIGALRNDGLIPEDIKVVNATNSAGISVIVDIGKEDPDDLIQRLLWHSKTTGLQVSFSASLNCIVGGEIRGIGVIEAIQLWIEHRRHVVRRRSRYRKERAETRLHLVEGFLKAVPIADQIIVLVRESPSRAEAIQGMVKRWKFSEDQAGAILDMTVGQVTRIGVDRYEDERDDLTALIKECNELLTNRKVLDNQLKIEMRAVRDTLGSDRRTVYRPGEDPSIKRPVEREVFVPATNIFFAVTGRKWIRQSRKRTITMANGSDYVVGFTPATDQNRVEVITNFGAHFRFDTIDLPQTLTNALALIPAEPEEEVVFVGTKGRRKDLPDFVMVTSEGLLKRVAFENWSAHRNGRAYEVIGLTDGDEVSQAFFLFPGQSIAVATANGRILRLDSEDLAPKGDKAKGIAGINLVGKDDAVVWAGSVTDDDWLVYWTENDKVGQFPVEQVAFSNRGTRGVSFTGTKDHVAGVTIAPGGPLYWFDGSTDEPQSIEIESIPEGLGLNDSKLKVEAVGITKAPAVWCGEGQKTEDGDESNDQNGDE